CPRAAWSPPRLSLRRRRALAFSILAANRSSHEKECFDDRRNRKVQMIPTRQYQAAARKKPCKGYVPRGLVEGFKLFVPSRRHAAIAFRALLRARRALIAQSSSKRTAS